MWTFNLGWNIFMMVNGDNLCMQQKYDVSTIIVSKNNFLGTIDYLISALNLIKSLIKKATTTGSQNVINKHLAIKTLVRLLSIWSRIYICNMDIVHCNLNGFTAHHTE